MSRNELKKKIDVVNGELLVLLKCHNYNLLANCVIACSQDLDELIVAYIQSDTP
jgi:hypothetical protein